MTEPHSTPAADLALFSGGGSGGHVFPGLAVADELGRRGWRVGWAGSEQGLEGRLVRERGVDFHPLPARPLVGQGLAGKARSTWTLLGSAWRARSLVRRLDAKVVVGTGGYVSAPAVLGGRLARRPVLLVEPNADVGFANRWLSRLAAEAAVAHEATGPQLACPSTVTGVPIRDAFHHIAPELPEGDPLRLLVLGGSQGARQINELLPPALAALGRKGMAIAVTHQAGEKNLDATHQAYAVAGLSAGQPVGGDEVDSAKVDNARTGSVKIDIVPFLDDVASAMANSHLVVSRAGAITLAEICAAGRPSLLVPLSLAGAHQVGNAQRLEAAGAARRLASDATATDLEALLGELLGDRSALETMARSARQLGRPDAASAIADRVEALGRQPVEGAA